MNDALTRSFVLWESKKGVGIDTVRQGFAKPGVRASFLLCGRAGWNWRQGAKEVV